MEGEGEGTIPETLSFEWVCTFLHETLTGWDTSCPQLPITGQTSHGRVESDDSYVTDFKIISQAMHAAALHDAEQVPASGQADYKQCMTYRYVLERGSLANLVVFTLD